jgi:serine protease AprX
MGFETKSFARLMGLVMLILVACGALIGGTLQARAGAPTSIPAGDPMSKIDKQVLKDTANGQKTSFVILLADQADVSAAYAMKDQDARGWYVYNTLRDHAAQTQAPIRAVLTSAGASYQPYWVANMIVATGDLQLVQSLAARPDVKSIDSNDPARWIEDPAVANYQPAPASPDTVEWGVNNVNAPAVWALGYTGQGIVVGNEDTGMRWTHNALKPKYRGWNGTVADHNYNWHDSIHSGGGACGANSLFPCDDYGHGTHTTGTTVGDDGSGNQIGVAPGAQWIGCRNMDQGNGTPATYTECFQFMIAPTDLNGQNPNPALRPHVINNSWGCPASEGCTTRGELETIVNNTQAAGIFVEASAGNSGSACSSVTDPPAIYSASFSTGAIDIGNNLASFSSRGPSTYYTPNLLKPNISAPGVNVRSAVNSGDASYTIMSGTSMAGPHVVGVVALLWSARPQLSRDITTTKTILQNTANPNVVTPAQTCGGIPSSQIPNNSFGYGRVDALAAVNSVAQGTPTPTRTGTPPTATRTNTVTLTPTPTATPCSLGVIVNGDFETGSFPPWVILGTNPTPTVVTGNAHGGNHSALFGTLSGPEPLGDSSIYQTITVPASGGTLSYWWNGGTTDTITFDWQDAYITNTSGGILATIQHTCTTTAGWQNQTFNMAPYAGQTVRIEFLVHQDGFGDDTYMYVDDVLFLTACATGTPATATRTSTVQATATGTPYIDLIPAMVLDHLCTGQPDQYYLSTNVQPLTPVPVTTTMHLQDNSGNFINYTVPAGVVGYTAPCPYPCLTGGYPFTLTVDYLNQLPETNESNNSTMFVQIVTHTPCPQYTPSRTPTYTPTRTPTGPPLTGTGTPTHTPTNTPTHTATNTPTYTPTNSGGATVIPTNTGTNTATDTPTDTPNPVSGTDTPTVTVTSTVCPIQFSDVPNGSTFYPYIRCLACRGIVNGYSDGTFRPYNNVTRGQLTKIVSIGGPYPDPHTQTFQDVPPGSTFYIFVERLAARGYISGYPCGVPGEPCVPPGNLPYFRTNNNATRGQITKIVSNVAGFIDPPAGQIFEDVPPGSTFYTYTQRLASRGVMQGYPCGGVGEPCVPPTDRPYFRTFNNATRGQTSKIVANTFFPNCDTPSAVRP